MNSRNYIQVLHGDGTERDSDYGENELGIKVSFHLFLLSKDVEVNNTQSKSI